MAILRTSILKTLFPLVLTAVIGFWPCPARATSTIAMTSLGGTSFDLQGIDVSGAAAFDITISYDASGLSGPVVTQGSLVSGAMMAINTNTPGAIRIALIRTTPVQGTGSIASIVFSGSGGSGIKALSAALADINGKSIPSTVQINNSSSASDVNADSSTTTKTSSQSPVGSDSGSTSSESSTGTSATGSGSQTAVLPGGIIVAPGQTVPQTEQKQPAEETVEEAAPEKPSTPEVKIASRGSDDQVSLPAKRIFSQESVLDRFKNYKGPRSAQAYIMLFRQESMIGFKQSPGVAISDGVTPIRVSFLSASDVKSSPDVALTNARLLSLKRDTDNTNTWIADILPERGALSASLAVSQGDLNMIFPIVTAPACDINLAGKGTVDENVFAGFLNNRSKEKSKYDVNKDGKVDYIDDYIFTANYIRFVTTAPTGVKGK